MSTMPSSPASTTSSSVTAGGVASRLSDASDPLGFIQQNLRKEPAPVATVEQVTAQPVAEAVIVPNPTQEPSFQAKEDIGLGDNLDLPYDDGRSHPPVETPKEEAPQVETKTNSLLDEVDTKKKAKQDSMSEARRTINELKVSQAEKDSLLDQYKRELEEYKTGIAVPDVIKQKDERIAKLEGFEKLVDLRLSPEYQNKYVEPMNQLSQKASKISVDYGVDPQILNEALNIENQRERNAYLRQHFDDVGALEIRGVLNEIEDLTEQAAEAERQPATTWEKLKQEHQAKMVEKDTIRVESIRKSSRDGWVEAMGEIRQSGEYPELTMTGDSKTDAVVKPILDRAAQEYGKFISLMGAKRMEELPAEVAKILAKRFLLSEATGVAMASRNHHYTRAEEIVKENKRQTPLLRPQVGGGQISGGGAPPVRSKSPEDAADMLLNKVLAGR